MPGQGNSLSIKTMLMRIPTYRKLHNLSGKLGDTSISSYGIGTNQHLELAHLPDVYGQSTRLSLQPKHDATLKVEINSTGPMILASQGFDGT